MTKCKKYSNPIHSVTELESFVLSYLAGEQNMVTQVLHDEGSIFTVVQARTRGGKVKQVFGLNKALTLRFAEDNGAVNVEIGGAKWLDKATTMTVGMFVFAWPLAVTSGVGIYKQRALIRDLIKKMNSYMCVLDADEDKGIGEKVVIEAKKVYNSRGFEHVVAGSSKFLSQVR